MVKRCPHCQTKPLRADAEACWYCGKDYPATPRSRRPAHLHRQSRAAGPLPARNCRLVEPR